MMNPVLKRIFLISGDNFLVSQVASLEAEGFEIRNEKRISFSQNPIRDFAPQVILLDSENNRELATLEFCYYLKTHPVFRKCRVIVLSDRGEDFAEIAAFDAGADDFIRKPVRPPVLRRRMEARMEKENSEVLIQGDPGNAAVKIDPQSYSVFLGPHAIHVSRKEFELLYLMASRPGKIFNRNELYEQVWKKKYSYRDRTVDVHILRLRRKLGKDIIQTQKGIGYRFHAA